MTRDRLIINHFVPTLLWGRETGNFHTRVAIFNYLSYHFPKEETRAKLYLRFFDERGHDQGVQEEELCPFGQCQYELCGKFSKFEGTIAVQLVPCFSFKPPVEPIMTNYFVVYHDDAGHCDFSHEQNGMIFNRAGNYREVLTPVRNSDKYDISLVLQNAYYGEEPERIDPTIILSLRDRHGRILESERIALEARASRVLRLVDLFPKFQNSSPTDLFSVMVAGRFQNQYSFVRYKNGDFNFHHC